MDLLFNLTLFVDLSLNSVYMPGDSPSIIAARNSIGKALSDLTHSRTAEDWESRMFGFEHTVEKYMPEGVRVAFWTYLNKYYMKETSM